MSAVDVEQLQPISRTYQYRKVMKPMLERKRRARINRCLDELKELMLTALQAEGENVSKLEKADILELTVQHLHKLRRQHRLSCSPTSEVDRFRAGFTHCASEVSRCLASTPGVDVKLGAKLMTHLGHRLNDMEKCSPLSVRVGVSVSGTCSPAPSSPSSVSSLESSSSYGMPLTPPSPCSSRKGSPTFSETSMTSSCDTNRFLTIMDMSAITKRSAANTFTSAPVWRPW